MSDKKNIDRLFMERLKGFEATPSDSVWENISTELKSADKGRKPIPIWWKAAGIAASLLLLFTISQVVFNNETDDTTQETIVNIDSMKTPLNNDSKKVDNNENAIVEYEQKNESENLKSETSNSSSNNSIDTVTPSAQNLKLTGKGLSKKVIVDNKISKENGNTSNIDKNEFVKSSSDQTKNAIADNTNSSKNNTKKSDIDKAKIDELLNTPNKTSEIAETNLIKTNIDENKEEIEGSNDVTEEDKLSITEEVAANKEEENVEDITEEAFERWKVASNIAPVYFNTLGKGSSIHPQFNNNSKSGDINMSYGISGSYAINKKLSVRAGINKVNLGYSTNDVVVYNTIGGTTNPELLRNIELNEVGKNLSFISVDEFNFAQVPSLLNNFIDSSIDQRLGFIEIPLELEYKISNKKMGINLIGGFSALFLNNNEVYSVLEGNSTLLGKATNINSTSFSANFGLGFDYKILDKFKFNLEPVFKYQLNTFNNTSGNFKPYFIGVYSGLSFKF